LTLFAAPIDLNAIAFGDRSCWGLFRLETAFATVAI
jgi:hypothetical protein